MARAAKFRKKSGPRWSIDITLAPHAPKLPGEQQFTELFACAWTLVPAGNRAGADSHGVLAVDVHIMNDSEISELNAQHMNHAGPTDVLSFGMGELDPVRKAYHLGEIVVSFETAQREAAARELPLAEELCRYCVHGFLHLLGYEDDTPAKRKAMFKIQEAALATTVARKRRTR